MCDIESMRKTRSAGLSPAAASGFGMIFSIIEVRLLLTQATFRSNFTRTVASCHQSPQQNVVPMPQFTRPEHRFAERMLRHEHCPHENARRNHLLSNATHRM